jgi:NADH dehydrogenase
MADRAHVVVVGAGFGGINAARHLADAPVDITIVDPNNFHTFLPLLYQVATAGLNAADVAYVVRGVFQKQPNVGFHQGSVATVDWDRSVVVCTDGHEIAFDHLIVAAGSTTNYFGVPGAADHAFPLYALTDATRLRNHVIRRFEEADSDGDLVDRGELTLVVVGGGPTGVEVAGALAELVERVLRRDYHHLDVDRSKVVLLEQAEQLLTPFSRRSQDFAREVLARRGVEVRLGTAVAQIDDDRVVLRTGESIPTRTVIWAAGVQARPLASKLGVAQGRGGRVTVDADLSIPGHPDAYCIGDIADIDDGEGGRLPQLAQVAIQGGRHAAHQIERRLAGRPTEPFRYRDKGTMATIGRRAAVAELPIGVKLRGGIAWVAWLLLHLLYLLGMRNRVSVVVNWAWNYFTWDRGPRFILDGSPSGAPTADLPGSGSTPADEPAPTTSPPPLRSTGA